MNRTRVQIGILLSAAIAALAAGCSAPVSSEAQVSIADATQTPFIPLSSATSIETSTSTSEPTLAYNTPAPPTPFAVEDFSDFEMNIASGEVATDFVAPLLDGSNFRLSNHRGRFVLIFPTVLGCGDCMYGLNIIAATNEAHPDSQLDILILDLYAGDSPSVWTEFADFIDQDNISWGVVGSETFAIDYQIDTLGTMMLINPEGKVVFRSKHPIAYYEIEALFELIDEHLKATQG